MMNSVHLRRANRALSVGVGAVVLSLLVGCGPRPTGGTDVGNGITLKLSLQGYEDVVRPDGAQLPEGVRIDSVWMAFGDARVAPLGNCKKPSSDDDDDSGAPEPADQVADLLTGDVLGGELSYPVMSTDACAWGWKWRQAVADEAPAGTPAELDGLTLRVTGARGDGVPFEVRSTLSEQLWLKATEFQLERGVNHLLLGFETSSWIDALNLDALDGPTILVDAENNESALDHFDDAVSTSALLFRDLDGDGKLSSLELSSDNVVAN